MNKSVDIILCDRFSNALGAVDVDILVGEVPAKLTARLL